MFFLKYPGQPLLNVSVNERNIAESFLAFPYYLIPYKI